MYLGEKIKEIRKDHNLSQEQFAAIFHVTRQTVSNWENNKNYPDISSLKQISDEFDVSFDILLKEDEQYIKKTDNIIKHSTLLKRIIPIGVLIIITLLGAILWMFHVAYAPTSEGARINSNTNVKMLVSLQNSSPSRAITYTTDLRNDDKNYLSTIDKYRKKVLGRVEGDIPAVFLDSDSNVTLHFQNRHSIDIKPEQILNVTVQIYDKNSDTTNEISKDVSYELEGNDICVMLSPQWFHSTDNNEFFYECIITVEYQYDGKNYTSVTAVNVFNS